MKNKINMPFKTDIKKYWYYLEGEELKLFVEYFRKVVCGTNMIDGVIYYHKKMTHKQMGKVTGFAECLQRIDYNLL